MTLDHIVAAAAAGTIAALSVVGLFKGRHDDGAAIAPVRAPEPVQEPAPRRVMCELISYLHDSGMPLVVSWSWSQCLDHDRMVLLAQGDKIGVSVDGKKVSSITTANQLDAAILRHFGREGGLSLAVWTGYKHQLPRSKDAFHTVRELVPIHTHMPLRWTFMGDLKLKVGINLDVLSGKHLWYAYEGLRALGEPLPWQLPEKAGPGISKEFALRVLLRALLKWCPDAYISQHLVECKGMMWWRGAEHLAWRFPFAGYIFSTPNC